MKLLEQGVEAPLALGAALVDDFKYGADVVLDGQAAEDRSFLRQIADAQPRAAIHRHAADVETIDFDGSLVHRHQPGDHVEAGGLAGAIRPEQADSLAGPYAERNAAHDLAALVALGEAARDERALELRATTHARTRQRLRIRGAAAFPAK